MSKVIAFRAEQGRKPVLRVRGEAGRILLFTGVRYIRDEDESEASPEPTVVRTVKPAPLDAAGERLQA